MMVKAKGGKLWHKKAKEAGARASRFNRIGQGGDVELFKSSRLDLWTRHILFDFAHHIGGWIIYLDAELGARERKRLEQEIPAFANLLETVCMDSRSR